jgi:hypothetical protein
MRFDPSAFRHLEVISGWSPDAALKASEIHVWGSIPLTSANGE